MSRHISGCGASCAIAAREAVRIRPLALDLHVRTGSVVLPGSLRDVARVGLEGAQPYRPPVVHLPRASTALRSTVGIGAGVGRGMVGGGVLDGVVGGAVGAWRWSTGEWTGQQAAQHTAREAVSGAVGAGAGVAVAALAVLFTGGLATPVLIAVSTTTSMAAKAAVRERLGAA